MTGDWLLLGEKLRACRKAKRMTLVILARKSGYSERTLRRYEQGNRHVDAEIVETIATALGVAADSFARPAVSVRDPRLPALTRLRQLVAWEVARKAAPPILVKGKSYARFGARLFHDVNTAWRVHEGSVFALAGELRDQRELFAEESKLLGCARGIGACFHLFVTVAPNEALGVTVFTCRAEDTRRLQSLLHGDATLLARIAVLADDAPDGEGFAFFITDRRASRQPWALVVDVIATPAM